MTPLIFNLIGIGLLWLVGGVLLWIGVRLGKKNEWMMEGEMVPLVIGAMLLLTAFAFTAGVWPLIGEYFWGGKR